MTWIVSILLIISIIGNVILFLYCKWASKTLREFAFNFSNLQDMFWNYREHLYSLFDNEMFKYHKHKEVLVQLTDETNQVLYAGNVMNDSIKKLMDVGVLEQEDGQEILDKNVPMKSLYLEEETFEENTQQEIGQAIFHQRT